MIVTKNASMLIQRRAVLPTSVADVTKKDVIKYKLPNNAMKDIIIHNLVCLDITLIGVSSTRPFPMEPISKKGTCNPCSLILDGYNTCTIS